ncbi:NADH-quinone oxidoreductase subunit I [Mycobacterium intracellulare subsp. chimaera]|uniref:NADH-quinone oxidoreductase subunit A n=1 Tax=Mycobacterium intracellulare TaxID=1767 RepID=UPI0006CA8F79|nr:NADH-quinone oxidoreductase subunit A [Mycobacterium intracellulare]KPN48500.1 NADH-quinone oxidoreductase subunit I [Mycobacterium intracellulare subsp. chimaera]
MYAGMASMMLLSVAGVISIYGLHRFTAVSSTALTALPFLSGWPPEEHALSRYHVRWYLATLVFLAFDVEMLFMYPWALVVAKMGAAAITESPRV